MSIRRETLAFLVGTAGCVLAGFLPWCEIPSSADSWIGADGKLHILARECAPGFIARTSLIVFGLLSTVFLLFGRNLLVQMRYMAHAVLLFFLLIPPLIVSSDLNLIKDGQIIYNQVQQVVLDMELSINQQQVDWRTRQNFIEAGSMRLQSSQDPSSPPSLALDWSEVPEFVDRTLGLTNALLNLLGKGWYLALVCLTIWLLGAYSGDKDATRRRAKDLIALSLVGCALLIIILAPRIMSEIHYKIARESAALGNYREAALEFGRSVALDPKRMISLSYLAQSAVVVEQLGCDTCSYMDVRKAQFSLQNIRDFDSVVSLLERAGRNDPNMPGLRYWISTSLILSGYVKFNQGQYSAADWQFTRALKLVPIDAMAWYGKAMVQIRLRNFTRSAKYLENAVEIQNNLSFRRLTLQGQLHLVRAWSAFTDNDIVGAHENYSRYLIPESW